MLGRLALEITHPHSTSDFDWASQVLLDDVRRDIFSKAAIPVIVDLVNRDSPAAKGIRFNLINAVPESRLIAVLAALCQSGLTQKTCGYPTGIVRRLQNTTDPRAIPALVTYLKARWVEDPNYDLRGDLAFEILHHTFKDPPEAIELLWNSSSSFASSIKETTAEVLRAYRGSHWSDFVRKALLSPNERSQDLGLWIASSSNEVQFRGPFIDLLVARLLKNRSYPNGIFDGVKTLATLARTEPKAAKGLLQLYFSGTSTEGYAAGKALEKLGDEKIVYLEHDDWKHVVDEMKRPSSSSDPFEFASHFDVTPIFSELLALENLEHKWGQVASLIAAQRSDEIVAKALGEMGTRPPGALRALLGALRGRYLSQPWGRQVIGLLSSDDELAKAALNFLAKSTDPVVQKSLASLSGEVLQRNADPYDAIVEGLTFALSISRPQVHLRESFDASLGLPNRGVLPIRLPLVLQGHYARWQVAEGKSTLGPLLIGTNEAPRWIAKGQTVWMRIDLKSVVEALGVGAHSLILQYASRSEQRHWPEQPDFAVATAPVQINVLPSDAGWPSSNAAQALVNSPDVKRREAGWTAFTEEAPPDKNEHQSAYRLLRMAAQSVELPAQTKIRVEIYDQEIRHERYTAQAGSWRYQWDEEDIQGNLEVQPTLAERREFFQAMAESEFLQRKPIQNLASDYEKQVEIVIGQDRCKFWEFELLHRPVLARCYSRLDLWKKRAEHRLTK